MADNTAIRYSELGEIKSDGIHYTPVELACFLASQACNYYESYHTEAKDISIIDPACGDGQLLNALIDELRGRDLGIQKVSGFDTSATAIQFALERLSKNIAPKKLEILQRDFLEFTGDYFNSLNTLPLFKPAELVKADLLIANPPYVRTQVMGADKSQLLAGGFGLGGRVDLYHAFLLAMGCVIKPGGILSIVVSNRFMTTKTGALVRGKIFEMFEPLRIWDFGDTKLFDAAVLPAVLLLRRRSLETKNIDSKVKFTTIYEEKGSENFKAVGNIFDATDYDGIVRLADGRYFNVMQGVLDFGKSPEGVWRLANKATDDWTDTVERHTWARFRELGKIRVGVKTTADKVFIKSDWDSMGEGEKPEHLLPLITHHVARRFRSTVPTAKILYTHQSVGTKKIPVDLTLAPRTKAYLELHRGVLEAREYVIKAGRKWYEIWVPQDPSAWKYPKLVFRDIAAEPCFWIDKSGAVVNGDCYWIACQESENERLFWLAVAVGNSSFAVAYYDKLFNNKLYANRRRFMTQYVEKFPIPNPDTPISSEIIELAERIYDLDGDKSCEELERDLDRKVWSAFGLTPKKI